MWCWNPVVSGPWSRERDSSECHTWQIASFLSPLCQEVNCTAGDAMKGKEYELKAQRTKMTCSVKMRGACRLSVRLSSVVKQWPARHCYPIFSLRSVRGKVVNWNEDNVNVATERNTDLCIKSWFDGYKLSVSERETLCCTKSTMWFICSLQSVFTVGVWCNTQM